MPVRSAAVRAHELPVTIPPLSEQAADSLDARWAVWVEHGREHERAVKRNLRLALLGVAVIALPATVFYILAAGGR
jgi:hypothetical protein